MEVQRFEQAILKLAFETEARITTASVAYYLGIPSREANRLLNLLLEEGVLELDSDADGNLFYLVPHQGEHKQAFSKENFQRINAPTQPQLMLSPPDNAIQNNRQAPPLAANPPVSPEYNRPQLHPQPHFHDHPLSEPHIAFVNPNTPGDNSAAYTPQTRPPTHNPAQVFERAQPAPQPHNRYPNFGQDGDNTYGSPHRNAEWIQTQQPESRAFRTQTAVRENLFFGVTSRNIAPDAILDRCGSSSVILNTATRCEPQPLPDSTPTVVSCTGYEQFSSARDDYRFGFTSSSTALAAIPSNDYILDNSIEQPEHQPGMALLLSLILCGTGQIYNGEVSKGIIMMVLCFLLWFVLLGWVVHIWSIVDAVVVAERINRKHN